MSADTRPMNRVVIGYELGVGELVPVYGKPMTELWTEFERITAPCPACRPWVKCWDCTELAKPKGANQ
jgi:hypothetical protein